MQDSTYVALLQRDLKQLGFAVVGTADGDFGGRTFWALREFQSYSKYATVAQLNGTSGPLFDRLVPVKTGANQYQGHVDGIANTETRTLLEHWLASAWRCPVVINVWNLNSSGAKKSLEAQNVWLYNDHDVSSSKVAFFAHDLSGHFPHTGVLADGTTLLGRFIRYPGFGGPLSTPPLFTQPSAEITPENLIGRGYPQLSPAEQSTFRVVRAVSEVECLGFFDCINAYDSAIASIGPCHWTLGLVKRSNGVGQIYDGELCGTLAYAAWQAQAAFDFYFSFFGVNVRDDWTDQKGIPNGKRLFSQSLRKYASWLAFPDENGDYKPVPSAEQDGNYFKSWHWIYRFTAAMRESQALRSAIWDVARIRLRDVGSIPVDVSGISRRVDEVFTSEKARALLHRWHIYRPAEIASSGPGRALRRMVQLAAQSRVSGGWAGDPASWTDGHEKALIAAIDQTVQELGNTDLKNTVAYVESWPSWKDGANPRNYQLSDGLAKLSARRNSFMFHNTALPPKPYRAARERHH
ncbi:peptidoglycan-binding protein [Rhizobium ruizarguesonis]|uniref:peptidoglycan-binding domain-containing protein n=1 Tax=Rhizobium ruizarguesonis TaxID=2081791 RepID=UPI0013EF1A43|nr:peptidoglycan-binding domain-containing protein [Rhizobium ruizarguesonis]WSH25278.1 peptidoglycan-binding domain-containing protein [Rhizobium ruizarguesonis]